MQDKASFGYIADAWLETKKKTVAKSTYEGYINLYNYYIKDVFLMCKIKDIEPIDINNFMTSFDFKAIHNCKNYDNYETNIRLCNIHELYTIKSMLWNQKA